MKQIFVKEFNGFLNSLIGYVAVGIFLVSISMIVWVLPETSVLDYGYADLGVLFSAGPFVLLFLVPAITMRSLAEERKMGTLELLMTKPLTEGQIVLGKFMASFLLVIVSLIPTALYYYMLYQLGSPVGNIDASGVLGSFIGLSLLGGLFCAIGVFASSVSSNQVVSFIVAAFVCFVFYSGIDSVAGLISNGELALMVKQFGMLYHYESMSKGVIDSRDVIYFLSMYGIFLVSTKTVLSSRAW